VPKPVIALDDEDHALKHVLYHFPPVQKIKGTMENAELRQTLASIFGPASSHGA
jgi:hypothetical protein